MILEFGFSVYVGPGQLRRLNFDGTVWEPALVEDYILEETPYVLRTATEPTNNYEYQSATFWEDLGESIPVRAKWHKGKVSHKPGFYEIAKRDLEQD